MDECGVWDPQMALPQRNTEMTGMSNMEVTGMSNIKASFLLLAFPPKNTLIFYHLTAATSNGKQLHVSNSML